MIATYVGFNRFFLRMLGYECKNNEKFNNSYLILYSNVNNCSSFSIGLGFCKITFFEWAWFPYIVVWTIVACFLQSDYLRFYTIYRRYKIALEDPQINDNVTQQLTANALSEITFLDFT